MGLGVRVKLVLLSVAVLVVVSVGFTAPNTIGASNVDQGSNKKNGSSFTFTSIGGPFN